LPPVGLMLFSVGDTGALLEGVVVVVVVVVVDGASFPPPPQAVSPPIAMIAAPPAIAAIRRLKRREFMCRSYSLPRLGPFGRRLALMMLVVKPLHST
jgi:hypothetical protein